MPERKTLQRARRQRRRGKAATTQAGEFVREEIHHVRSGKHGARNSKQAIAIGLSKARRSGVKVPRNPKGRRSRRSTTGKGGRRTAARRASGRTVRARTRRRSSRRR
jgi:Family of unknown function (DUF6496)